MIHFDPLTLWNVLISKGIDPHFEWCSKVSFLTRRIPSMKFQIFVRTLSQCPSLWSKRGWELRSSSRRYAYGRTLPGRECPCLRTVGWKKNHQPGWYCSSQHCWVVSCWVGSHEIHGSCWLQCFSGALEPGGQEQLESPALGGGEPGDWTQIWMLKYD